MSKAPSYVRDAAISPSGARAVFEYRGEIVTVPAKKGDPRNLTHTTGVHERSPIWSPDGKSIAYFSDESGEYAIHIQAQDGKGEIKKFKLNGSGFYANPAWSPDGQKITFTDNGRSLYWLDTSTGAITKIATEYHYGVGPFGTVRWRLVARLPVDRLHLEYGSLLSAGICLFPGTKQILSLLQMA